MKVRHEYVLLTPPDPRVQIDVAIAGLIKQCWRLGFETHFCCEGDGSRKAYIAFAPGHAFIFAGAAGPMAWTDQVLQSRNRQVSRSRKQKEFWQWIIETENQVVRFPPQDIKRAEECLRRYASIPLLKPIATKRPAGKRKGAGS